MASAETTSQPGAATAIAPARRWLFRLVLLVLVTAMAALAAELILRYQGRATEWRDQIDAGLLRPDLHLGWSLTPDWKAGHRNGDFAVTYHTGGDGFRRDPAMPAEAATEIDFFGDSFVFGLGVNDQETFTHLLNRQRPPGTRYRNLAIPGTSTDQQVLLLEKRLQLGRPRDVVLVVYLGNDLIDNQLGMPMQLNLPKPRFVEEGGHLTLLPPPAPAGGPARPSYARAVYGEEYLRRSWRHRAEQRSALFRFLSEHVLPAPDFTAFQARHQPSVQLCLRLLERAAATCERAGVRLTVVLLGGRSAVEEPRSFSGQYQEFCHDRLLAGARERRWRVVDLLPPLRAAHAAGRSGLYHLRDGHLTPAGHRTVAAALSAQFGDGR